MAGAISSPISVEKIGWMGIAGLALIALSIACARPLVGRGERRREHERKQSHQEGRQKPEERQTIFDTLLCHKTLVKQA
jgi:hypothetical protein